MEFLTNNRNPDGSRPVKDMTKGIGAKQSFKDECDINIIVETHRRTGHLTHISQNMPQYGDFSNVPDFQTAFQQIEDAEKEFMSMPAALRERMRNDPGFLIAFLDDPANNQEAIDLGLVEGKRSVKPQEKRADLMEADKAEAREETPPITGGE